MSNQDSIHLTDKYLSDTITKNEEEDKQKDESIKVIDNITQETKIKFKEIERVLTRLAKDDDLENLKPLDKAQIKESQEEEEDPDIFSKDDKDKPPIPPIYGRIKKSARNRKRW